MFSIKPAQNEMFISKKNNNAGCNLIFCLFISFDIVIINYNTWLLYDNI